MSESVSESVNEAVKKTVKENLYESVNESVKEIVKVSVNQSMTDAVNASLLICISANICLCKSAGESKGVGADSVISADLRSTISTTTGADIFTGKSAIVIGYARQNVCAVVKDGVKMHVPNQLQRWCRHRRR